MNARVALLLVAIAAALGGAGCQILGIEKRIPCSPTEEAEIQACPAGLECRPDHFCGEPAVLDTCASTPGLARNDVTLSMASSSGVSAMTDTLFDGAHAITAALVADVHLCNDAGGADCGGRSDNPTGLQPLGTQLSVNKDVFSTVLSAEAIEVPVAAGLDYLKGFVVEVVFKAPPAPPTADHSTVIASMVAGTDGWALLQQGGTTAFVAGGLVVLLANRSDDTWHHVLCAVSPHALTTSPRDDDILCAIDGHMGSPAVSSGGNLKLTATPHDLVIGGLSVADATLDGAEIAVVRLWVDGNPTRASHTLERQDALLQEEQARLMRYLGLAIETPAPLQFLSTNTAADARPMPVLDRFVLVDAGWPRLARTQHGRGLLLEPERKNKIGTLITTCTAGAASAVVTPIGRTDACRYDDLAAGALDTTVIAQLPQQGLPEFGAGAPLVASVFIRREDGARVRFAMDNVGGPADPADGDCEVVALPSGDVGPEAGSDADCAVQVFGDWLRVVDRFVAAGTNITLHLDVTGDVWSPQLEIGIDPTTPLSYQVPEALADGTTRLVVQSTRGRDAVILAGVGLASSTSLGLRAVITSDGNALAMTPLSVLDTPDLTDHLAVLSVVPTLGDRAPRLDVVEGGTSVAFSGTFHWEPGQAVRIGADVGLPLDRCDGCEGGPVPATLPAPEQWDHVGFIGIDEPGVVVVAEVHVSGTAPLPLPLAVDVGPPQSGCLENARPDVALVACAEGACSESTPVAWVPKDGSTVTVSRGPAVGAQAVTGVFHADVPDVQEIGELFFEARFAPSGNDGNVLTLASEAGSAPILRVAVDRGDAVVVDADGQDILRLPGAWASGGAWTQLSCWLGLQSRCVLNAGAPQDLNTLVAIRGRALGTADVGGPAAAAVAFVRVWRVPVGLPRAEMERRVGARVASSFGFINAPRRAAFDIVEQRATERTIDLGDTKFVVGAHWPELLDDGNGGVAYVADAGEGLLVQTRDLTSFARTSMELRFVTAPNGTLLTLDDAGTGEVLTLSRADDTLHVVHRPGSASNDFDLAGFIPGAVFLGGRGDLTTLEGAEAPDMELTFPISVQPVTRLQLGNAALPAGSALKLHRFKIGPR